jgi:hypothetical protein
LYFILFITFKFFGCSILLPRTVGTVALEQSLLSLRKQVTVTMMGKYFVQLISAVSVYVVLIA